jgi:PqqD family protein of HPr-rel-A system
VIPAPGTGAWVCRRTAALRLRRWPEGGVVYDAADGSLSALSPVAAELMAMLLDGPAQSAASLAQRLLEAPPEPEDIDGVEQHLTQFQRLGLIEYASA